MLSAEQLAYELPEIWQVEWFPPGDHERVRVLADIVPPDARTLLDVGCGNGLFLNYLQGRQDRRIERLIGIDRSEAALAHLRTESLKASADQIPFDNQEFDIVTSHEVLEHLPLPIYSKALDEIARVARKYIMISVPYKQDLEASLCKCPECRARFNPDFHVRSFDESTVNNLFASRGFVFHGAHYLGKNLLRYDQEFRTKLRELFQKRVNEFPSYAICPVCGFSDKRALASELVKRKEAHLNQAPSEDKARRSNIRSMLAEAMPTFATYRWLAATYIRKSNN